MRSVIGAGMLICLLLCIALGCGRADGSATSYTPDDPPTYACVSDRDGIASWRTMARRLEVLDALGIPTAFHCYPGLGHGFGLGSGTEAEGWFDDTVAFWEAQTNSASRSAAGGDT